MKDFKRLFEGRPLAIEAPPRAALRMEVDIEEDAGAGPHALPGAHPAIEDPGPDEDPEFSDDEWQRELARQLGVAPSEPSDPDDDIPGPPTPVPDDIPGPPTPVPGDIPGPPAPVSPEQPPDADADYDPDLLMVTDAPRSWPWGISRIARTFPGSGVDVVGGIQMVCALHKKSQATGCKRFFRFEDLSPESVSATLRMAKHWANSGVSYTHQR